MAALKTVSLPDIFASYKFTLLFRAGSLSLSRLWVYYRYAPRLCARNRDLNSPYNDTSAERKRGWFIGGEFSGPALFYKLLSRGCSRRGDEKILQTVEIFLEMNRGEFCAPKLVLGRPNV